MKNLKFIFPIFLLGLFLAGCSVDEGPLPSDVEPLAEEESALKGAKKHAVPFKSKFEMWGEPILPTPPDDFYHQRLWGNGKATHMGKATIEIPDEALSFNFGVDPPVATATDVECILTGANGDELWFRYSSVSDPTMVPLVPGVIIVKDADGVIWGGTGKFEGASGNITYEGYWPYTWFDDPDDDPDLGPQAVFDAGICTFNGMIQY